MKKILILIVILLMIPGCQKDFKEMTDEEQKKVITNIILSKAGTHYDSYEEAYGGMGRNEFVKRYEMRLNNATTLGQIWDVYYSFMIGTSFFGFDEEVMEYLPYYFNYQLKNVYAYSDEEIELFNNEMEHTNSYVSKINMFDNLINTPQRKTIQSLNQDIISLNYCDKDEDCGFHIFGPGFDSSTYYSTININEKDKLNEIITKINQLKENSISGIAKEYGFKKNYPSLKIRCLENKCRNFVYVNGSILIPKNRQLEEDIIIYATAIKDNSYYPTIEKYDPFWINYTNYSFNIKNNLNFNIDLPSRGFKWNIFACSLDYCSTSITIELGYDQLERNNLIQLKFPD